MQKKTKKENIKSHQYNRTMELQPQNRRILFLCYYLEHPGTTAIGPTVRHL